MIECPQVQPLIDQGYLVKTRCYAPIDPDLKGIRTIAGDFHEGQLVGRIDKPALIHTREATGSNLANAGNRRLCRQRRHSIHLRDEFVRAGVRAEHIDATTPKLERDVTLERLANGEIELVTETWC